MSGGQKKVSNNLDGGNDQLPPEADPPLAEDGSPLKKLKKVSNYFRELPKISLIGIFIYFELGLVLGLAV